MIDLEMVASGQDFKTATRALAERYGVSAKKSTKSSGEIVATYPYHDEHGELLFEVCRFEPKDFRQRRPDGNGRWAWKLGDTRRVLYRLPDLLEADRVWICEGEKDADNLHNLGLCGTTSPQGAGKWVTLVKSWKIQEPLTGKAVFIVPDNDSPGRKHADEIARSLQGVARSVKVVQLPGLAEKQDVSDFIEQHGEEARERLLGLAEQASEYEPRPADTPKDEEDQKAGTKFQTLLKLFQESGSLAFKDQHSAAWIALNRGAFYENVPLNSDGLIEYLLKLYVDTCGDGIGEEPVRQASRYAVACSTRRIDLSNRFVASHDEAVIDLGWPEWHCARISATGVEIVQPNPSPFRRFAHQQALPEPHLSGDLRELLKFLPLKDSDAQVLALVWLTIAPLSHIARPGLVFYGPKGSGKSVICENLRRLLDPSSQDGSGLSRDHTEFVQFLAHNAVPILDNLHRLPQWASDDLCRAATGGGFSKRKLYSDQDDIIFSFRRTFLANGINIPAIN